MGGWRVLDLAEFDGELHSVRGGVRICPENGESQVVPVADVSLLLLGTGARCGGGVLHRLATADVTVVPVDWRGVPQAGMTPWSVHGRVGARARAQADLSLPRVKNAWGRVVRAKVHGQAQVLRSRGLCRQANRLVEIGRSVRSGDPANAEAHAARLYWRTVGVARTPGVRAGGVNGCLDYGYSILRGLMLRAVVGAGLWPALGVHHRRRDNAFSLVDDLVEPFRPAVDSVALSLREPWLEGRPNKHALVAACHGQFSWNGATVPGQMMALAQTFGRYVEGDVFPLDVPVWEGPYESAVDF